MFERRSRGPKTSTWTRRSQNVFESFFARRSELLKVAAEDQPHDEPLMTAAAFKWMFSSFGDEPKQVCAAQGAPIRSTVLGVTGTIFQDARIPVHSALSRNSTVRALAAAVDTDHIHDFAFGCRKLGPRLIDAILEYVILAGSSLSPQLSRPWHLRTRSSSRSDRACLHPMQASMVAL